VQFVNDCDTSVQLVGRVALIFKAVTEADWFFTWIVTELLVGKEITSDETKIKSAVGTGAIILFRQITFTCFLDTEEVDGKHFLPVNRSC